MLTLLLLLLPTLAQAQHIYGRTQDGGSLLLTNVPTDLDLDLIISAPSSSELSQSGAPVDAASEFARKAKVAQLALDRPPAPLPPTYRSVVDEAARKTRVSAALIHAVMAVESGFNPRAVSYKGAQGLMQLMPATARRFGVVNAFLPRDNVMGAARYLRELLDRFSGDLELSVAAYNAGEAAVERYGNRIPPFAETQLYVPKVMSHYRAYGQVIRPR